MDVKQNNAVLRTLDTADWKVSSETGEGVLLEMREWMRMVVSDSRFIVNIIFTLVFVTVISFDVSGTADVKVHSSSSLAGAGAGVLLCATLGGVDVPPTPKRSTLPDAVREFDGFIDC